MWVLQESCLFFFFFTKASCISLSMIKLLTTQNSTTFVWLSFYKFRPTLILTCHAWSRVLRFAESSRSYYDTCSSTCNGKIKGYHKGMTWLKNVMQVIVKLLVRFQYQMSLCVIITQWWLAPELSLISLSIGLCTWPTIIYFLYF